MSRPVTAAELIQDLRAAATRGSDDVAALQRFFKTGQGEYAEGDIFIGITVPENRRICRAYRALPIDQLEELLKSPLHEVRLAAVMIMAEQAKRADPQTKRALYDLYLRRTDRINNWDLVDASCRDVVGGYLMDKPRDELYRLARSTNLWERRIAMVSTWQFIRERQLEDTFKIAELLLNDRQDLIHKATGWMLREAGKRDEAALRAFLDRHVLHMPRTALRYAIERFSPEIRAHYLLYK